MTRLRRTPHVAAVYDRRSLPESRRLPRRQKTRKSPGHKGRFSSRLHAFSLVEVTIAIGVAAFCLLAIFALLPAGLTSNQASVQQTVAAGIAAGIAADLRAAPRNGPSLRYGLTPDTPDTPTPTFFLSEDGTKTSSASDFNTRYAAVVKMSGSNQPGQTVNVSIELQTPPGARAEDRTTVFEAWTALDRSQ